MGFEGFVASMPQGFGRMVTEFEEQRCRVEAVVSAAVPFAGCYDSILVMITM